MQTGGRKCRIVSDQQKEMDNASRMGGLHERQRALNKVDYKNV